MSEGAGNSNEQRNLESVPAHLRQHAFKPGESGNPKGRPKGRGAMERALYKFIDANPERIDGVIEALVTKAETEADVSAMKLLFERADGVVAPREDQTEKVDLSVKIVTDSPPSQERRGDDDETE